MANINFQVTPAEDFAVIQSGVSDSEFYTSSQITSLASHLAEVGETITVTANQTTLGGTFESWISGPCQGSTDRACTFTMTDDISLKARYASSGGFTELGVF